MTDAERAALVDQWTKGLRLDDLPPVSVKDIAMREALLAFLHGMPVSAVLTAHSACEIGLAELLAHYTLVHNVPTVLDAPEKAQETWSAADRVARRPSGIKTLLVALDGVGCWVPPLLRQSLITLAEHRHSLAHYRPIYKQGTLNIQRQDDRGFVGSFKASALMNLNLLEEYAFQAIDTMVDLRNMPNVSFTPGHPPPEDWVPTC